MNIILKKQYNEPFKSYDVMVVVIFCLENSYKKQDIYYNGLNDMINNISKIFPNMFFRIYYDSSIITPQHKNNELNRFIINKWNPLFDKLKNNKQIQLVKYEYPEFKINNLYHEQLFGSVIRFLPLFNFEEEISKNVIIMDIDNIGILHKTKLEFDEFLKSNSQFFFKHSSCSSRNIQLSKINKQYMNFIIPFAWDIFSKVKFDKNIFIDFINQIKNINKKINDNIYNLLNTFYKSIQAGNYQEGHKLDVSSKFPYGIDEILTLYLFNYYIKNKIHYSFSEITNMGFFLYDLSLRSHELSDYNDDDDMKYMMKRIMNKYYDNNKSLSENYIIYDYIVNKIENRKNINNNTIKLYKIFCKNEIKFANEILKNKRYHIYHINYQFVKCISQVKAISDNIVIYV